MAEVCYVKYNRTRQERFQIKTEIRSRGGARVVEKAALCPEGTAHIRSFQAKYDALAWQSRRIRPVKPEIAEDGSRACFPWLEGKTLAELLGDALSGDGQELARALCGAPGEGTAVRAFSSPLKAVRAALEAVCDARPEAEGTFHLTPDFMEVFNTLGELSDLTEEELSGPAFAASNIDGLFENMLVTRDGICAIDYEWVFLFPVPAGFIRYRTLYYFYRQFSSLMEYASFPDFLNAYGKEETNEKRISVYERMERGFQEYVHGENQRTYQEDFAVRTKTVRELAGIDGELERAKQRLEELRAMISDKDAELKREREVKRLTDNHVANLEIMIGDLRHEIEEMGKTLSYLNRHEALVFKLKRKLGQAFNKRYPKGTRKRKILGYGRRTILHPVQSLRMYTTEEGKNRIKGDFEIGEEYLAGGRLVFPRAENPTVSIIIPVYNQIRYTYLCLQSILLHTPDVSYEVIIADDVSTDATAHLGEFAENLVIRRNETNQGFLRNCNQAARAARGRYLMFLNNDTQVTDNWLSSLVSLIESDPSIGMVGSKLIYPDGRLQEAGGIIWSDGSGWNYGRLDNPDKAEYNYVKDVDYISGAAILIGADLWRQIGGFDERFAPAYCEDSDLAFEVRKAGRRVVYQPLSRVIHFEGVSNGTDVNGSGLKRYQVENSRKLKEKWSGELKRQCVNTGNPNPFRARERSMGKPVILVVDHYVPTFDKDAGSKTTFQYLKMFLKMGYAVKFLGDNFLHEEPYTTVLQQMGIEVLYGQEYVAGIWDWLDRNGKEIAIAYLNRPHIAAKYVDYIAEHTDMKIIYYGHDLHFLREFREYELTGDLKKRRDSEYWKSVEFSLMHKAAVSYYPSEVEIQAIRAADETVPVKAITAYVFDEFLEDVNRDFAKREGLLFVGGFAHPPNADAVLWFAREIFPKIRERLDVTFYVVGSRVTEEIRALESPGNGIAVKGFVSEEELSALYQSCRIVVVPLRYGAGVKGKVVEAVYNGAPVVTTSVGSEGIPDVEQALVIEDTAEAFADAVVSLYGDRKRLEALSDAARDYIRRHFSTEAAWSVIRDDFVV
ncbi:glycosyltransferase [Clostridiaceae bacterium]|nr:glycosyltransferase [Clostridiaceae bacterium]